MMETSIRQLHATIDRLQDQVARMAIRQQQQEKAMEYLARVIDRMRDEGKPETSIHYQKHADV